ncbi:uncharacterized protein LOC143046954 [Mytilus galloprovincialis]|uniref:uncharacterized protein LOC143046954 n=1 Tax=Mytilus galloprovincialis TaxID=29158 RepID=UPI003F7B6AF5
MEEIDDVQVHKVDSMSSTTCLVKSKGVYTTQQMADCKIHMQNVYCNGNNNRIIFRLKNRYLQWICHNLKDNLGKPYFRVISRITCVKPFVCEENATTAFDKPESITYIYTSTTTPLHAGVSRPDNYAIIICNCVLFLLVLLVVIALYLKHFRQRKTDTTLNARTSSTREEPTSSTSQSPRISNYEQISEVIISRPFHITNETYSDTCVLE